jgi:hypothetical protein
VKLTSRPDEEESTFALEALSDDELELIAAFLNCTRLGHHVSPYRDAAFELINKLTDMRGDDFFADAAINVDLHIDVMDSSGHLLDTISHENLEIVV